MKKTLLILSTTLFLAPLSCKKSTDGNKSVIQQENGYSADLPKDTVTAVESKDSNKNTQEYTERYVGDDGTSALVTFKNTDNEKMISIRSNNKTISAPQKEAFVKGGIYGDFDIEIIAKNDSVTITQGGNVITLKKARGQ
ncbi:hypothetical protein FNJ88_04335 [Chryseobacterium sp. SNU WT5]|uniref:hypothetical protein n=1 Tax=Chryseobacterium sp. SNU WT5 TaxID=2594269 RepID=UPI00117F415D|nr:hypothetical protein [Chryseobacterium sp. SNU WT5]QDP84814.1 hypothetical protein FNJ88_04335 [Chryseobacterium sp. SNU WT5]